MKLKLSGVKIDAWQCQSFSGVEQGLKPWSGPDLGSDADKSGDAFCVPIDL